MSGIKRLLKECGSCGNMRFPCDITEGDDGMPVCFECLGPQGPEELTE